MKLKPWVRVVCFFIVIIFLFSYVPKVYDGIKSFKMPKINLLKEAKKKVNQVFNKDKINKEINTKYLACLDEPFSEEDNTEELQTAINELNNYIKNNYRMSVKYEDLKTGFSYTYNSDTVYYAASTIKLVDALYIYEKAAAGEINLDDTITLPSSAIAGAPEGLKNHKVGEEIPIRTLVKYAVSYSDNLAHDMLIKYIGFSNLKAYGNSLGATHTLVGGDNFGEINVDDATIYLKKAYSFINENNELGKELKSFMVDALENALTFDGINADVAHKYGEYDAYFNDLGIVYDENPYVISVLTTHGKGDFMNIVQDISKRVNALHKQYRNIRLNRCQNLKD